MSSVTPANNDKGPLRPFVRSEATQARIRFVLNILPPYRVPLLKIIGQQERFQLEIWLMSGGERNRRWSLSHSELPLRVFPDWGLDLSDNDGPIIHANPGLLLRLVWERPDLVLFGGYSSITNTLGCIISKVLAIPYLLWIESTQREETLLRKVSLRFLRMVARGSRGVIVPGTEAREFVTRLGVDSHRIFVARNSVDIDAFRPTLNDVEKGELRESLGLQKGMTFLYVGRLTEKKGLRDLVDAFSRMTEALPDAKLILIGHGPLFGPLEKRISADVALRGRVRLLGPIPYDRLPDYYRACDVFVFPTYRDVWGFVLNEAMSSGLPVVSSDRAGAARDLVDHMKTGFLFEAGNLVALKSILETLATDHNLRARIGGAARERIIERFTPPHQAIEIGVALVEALTQ